MGQPSRLRECKARDKGGSGTKCRETPEEIRGKGEGRGGERAPRSAKDCAPGGLGWKPNSARRGGDSLEPLHPATAGMLRTRLLGQLGCSRRRSGPARSAQPTPASAPQSPTPCGRRGRPAHLAVWGGAGPPATRGSGGGGGTRGAGKGLAAGAWPELPPLHAPPPPVPGPSLGSLALSLPLLPSFAPSLRAQLLKPLPSPTPAPVPLLVGPGKGSER